MNKKRILGLLGVVGACALLVAIGTILSEEEKATLLDQNGNIIAEIKKAEDALEYQSEDAYWSFIDVAWHEATEIIAEQQQISKEKAEKYICENNLIIKTTCDQSGIQILDKVYEDHKKELGNESAAALSSTKGELVACISFSRSKQGTNFVSVPTYAGSTMKPLSVYALGMEEGIINWSSMYMDAPYMKVKEKDGSVREWPQNTEPFSYQNQTMETALEKSNNAIAVKVLNDIGVDVCCDYLTDKMKMDISEELKKIPLQGTDSVLSNLALGYLEKGVTVLDMIENYQVFANNGMRNELYAVTEILSTDGEIIYAKENEEEQILSSETAYIMNRLLREVVKDGTGAKTDIEDLEICGKTGTSTGYKDNWFIGMTPEYVGAVWYSSDGGGRTGNQSVLVFKEIMQSIEHNPLIKYRIPENILSLEYCLKTGKIADEHCMESKMGYYSCDNIPDVCNCLP